MTTSPVAVQTANPQRRPRRIDGYQALLLVAIALFVLLFAVQALQLHAAMRTHKADLGQIDQAVWNSSRGRFLEQTDNGYVATRLTDHVEPILVLISPVFWLWDDVRALLLLQAIAVAAGAWPLYFLALRRLDRALTPRERDQIWHWEPSRRLTRPIALTLALAFLLAPQGQSAVLTEFHAAPLAVPLILWALWAVEAQRRKQMVAATLLLALVKEEMALLAALLGLWAMWRSWRQARDGEGGGARPGVLWGTLVAALGLAWFGIATFVVVPHFARAVYGVAESGYFARYGALGDSPVDILRSLVTRPATVWAILSEPARIHYLWALLAPFGFLSLLAPDVLLLSLPVLLANLLSAYPAQFYGEFHYSAPVFAYFAAAAAFGAGRLWGWVWRRTTGASPAFQHLPAASAGAMAVATVAQNPSSAVRPVAAALLVAWIGVWAVVAFIGDGRGPWGGRYDPVTITEHDALLERFTAQIPADATLTATAAVHPHVSHRPYVYQFPLGLEAPQPATWALLDVTTNTDMAPGDLKAQVDQMLGSGWGVVDAADGFLLLAQGAPGRTIPEEFYTLTRGRPDQSQAAAGEVSVEIDDWPRWRQTRLTGVWPAWDASAGRPEVEVVTPAGDRGALFEDATPPALVWQPGATWQAGDAYRVTSLPLTLPRTVAVRAAVAGDATVLRRVAGDRLESLPFSALQAQEYGSALAALTGRPLAQKQATLSGPTGPLRMTTWLEDRATWPGDTVDLWLQWQGDSWPAAYVPFVHLRRNGANVAQADGPPRLFDRQTADGLAADGYANDWRTLTIPSDAPLDGEYAVLVGFYDPASGTRLRFAGGEDEFVAGLLRLRRAIPDQTCALNPSSCASQPEPW